MLVNPKISLAIDNCFASKRWTRPMDWMSLIKDMGITLVEASADTECDPLYMGEEYTREWIDEVKRCSERTGIKVVNLYSGHGTYSTIGLAHTDERVRLRFRDKWMKVQADTAKQLDAGLGFFAHAIYDPGLQEPKEYESIINTLYGDLADLAVYAKNIGLSYIGVEQMYSPSLPPWTLEGSRELLRKVYEIGGVPFYLTLDVGHMNGQQYFQKPTPEKIEKWIDSKAAGTPCISEWLGPKKAMDIFEEAVNGKIDKKQAIKNIQELWKDYDYMFADSNDGSVQQWLQELAGYSPIIHLQQSDGKSSPHWPFSPEFNKKGIIKGEDVIRSIAKAYSREHQKGMPPLCKEIVLTLEPFISTSGNNYDALEQIMQSVQYWRQFITKDGMMLSDVLNFNLRYLSD